MGAGRNSDGIDVVIVGGGPAGMSAALVLGRMRRRVLVCDAEAPANAVSHGVGGLLTRDGTPPAELRAIGRDELAKYPTVELRPEDVTAARRAGEGFEVDVGGRTVATRKLLLAHGLDYHRPDVDGVEELWGDLAFHCPYCHGWEVRDKAVGVVCSNAKAVRQALLLRSLSDRVVVFADGSGEIDEEARAMLQRGGVDVVEERLERVERSGDGVRLSFDGREPADCEAIFVQPRLELACDLAARLGAELDTDGAVATEGNGATGVAGLYVAGDAGPPPQAVAAAIGTGAVTATAINLALALDEVA